MSGRLEDVQIYNYALSAAEVAALDPPDTLAPAVPTGLRVVKP